ncbi:anthocyanidin 3-O-glucosyltransferase 7-like [Pyrus ussuriensis x Pyrus communis]|uniref:Glycosyltransferase n=1 Tax=Pyrus ussuriensis x Pyrus communis TaxID=2448454 RepID=A0A5N5I6M7_9ROSA|nr:anthocyanidin 3-O-glucosyltransferase 7-like [Pyrus ussuriensis x Pyrus communis]
MPVIESSKQGHVLSFPFGGHIEPLLNLVCRLANSTSPNMCFSFLSSEKSNNLLFSEKSKSNIPSDIKHYNVSDGVPKTHVLKGHSMDAVELFIKATPENYKIGIEKAVTETGKKISCLITDGFLVFAGEMAQNWGVPWIPLWIPMPCTLSAHIYTDLIRRELFQNYVGLDIKWGKMLHQMTALFLNSYQEINPTLLNNDLKSKVPKLLNVGFLTASLPAVRMLAPSSSDSTGCLSWLDEQPASSVAYICFGTIGSPTPNEMIALAEALEASGVSFLWSLKDNFKDLSPSAFVERITNKNGKIVPWAPQAQVLAHTAISVFVTHSGTNSVYESVVNGVPMICRPLFGDQRMNGRMVEDVWGIGVKIEGGILTKSGVLESLELISGSEQGKKMREKARALKEIVAEAAGSLGSAVQDFTTLVDVIFALAQNTCLRDIQTPLYKPYFWDK